MSIGNSGETSAEQEPAATPSAQPEPAPAASPSGIRRGSSIAERAKLFQ